MHYPVFMLPIIGALIAPAVWLIASYAQGVWLNILPVIMCWVACMYAAYKDNLRSRNLFISSGTTKAAEHAYEHKIIGSGRGDDFFTSHRSLGFADFEDFRTEKVKQVSFEEILKYRPFSIEPYCIDDERRQVIFVEMPMAFDSAMVGPFYFSTQRDYAQRLFSVPYEEFHRVCENLGELDMGRLILLFNTSRCGSTLVSKAFDSMAGVQSISEPDVFTSLTHMAAEAKEEGDAGKLKEIGQLAKSAARLLLFLRGNRYPDRPILALKFRFQVIHISDIMKEVLPEARSMFLYRNANDVIDSMGAAFINDGIYKVIRGIGLDVPYVFNFSALPRQIWKLIPSFKDERFPHDQIRDLGAVSPFTLGWLSVMEKALDAQRKGYIDTFFRYEDVVKHKEAFLLHVLQEAGFEANLESHHVFSEDSQKANVAQSSRRKDGKVSSRYAYLKSSDLTNIKRTLAMHPEIMHSDFIIPGTLNMDQ